MQYAAVRAGSPGHKDLTLGARPVRLVVTSVSLCGLLPRSLRGQGFEVFRFQFVAPLLPCPHPRAGCPPPAGGLVVRALRCAPSEGTPLPGLSLRSAQR